MCFGRDVMLGLPSKVFFLEQTHFTFFGLEKDLVCDNNFVLLFCAY